ncbi:F-box/LRR-repeat protein 4 [Bactrocera tryoni]|uniref:F-box/LRR-repeat protein 4 n=1 Tax=Bactrocera tryoni TaxID=59916 RepID=UPI001A9667EC|nr:F-box/LRR-repeat protein 4 [Bactrocera tryoni]XP_039947523.1 F-box/LRR-repeat protein 4 [Bactrocera tryoni]XP_039947524.1 F-box/LRR-repeat protein 4 [Bactrocera tryoni]
MIDNNMVERDTTTDSLEETEDSNNETPQCSERPLPPLHNEILINIFSYLPYTDLTQARLVCRLWMEAVAYTRFAKKFSLKIKEDNVQDIWRQLQDKNNVFASGMIYNHMVYMGIDAEQREELSFILRKIGRHVRSLKLKTLYGLDDLYECFPELERLTLEDLYVFPTPLPFELNAFNSLKSIHFVDDSVRQSSSEALLATCLRAKTTVKLEELSIRVYAEHAELFLAVLQDHADTLKSLHVVYFESINEPNLLVQKWMTTFCRLKKLEKIKIYACNTQIFEGTLKCLEGLPLRYLEVDCLRPVNPNICKLLESCSKRLEHLAFFNFYLPKSIAGMRIISNCCRHLKKLILSYTRLVEEDELCNIASNLVNLEVLVLQYCKNAVTNRSLAAIFKHLTGLRELDLSGNNDFDVNALRGSALNPFPIQRLQRLEKLNLKSCQQLSNDEFLATLKFPFLRSLSFGHGMYTDSGIQTLVTQCPLLEELIITYCPTLGRSTLFCIAKALPRLRVLHLLHCAQVDKSVRLILYSACPLLADLEISEKRTLTKTYFHQ